MAIYSKAFSRIATLLFLHLYLMRFPRMAGLALWGVGLRKKKKALVRHVILIVCVVVCADCSTWNKW